MPDPFAHQLAQDLEPEDVRHVLRVFEADLTELRDILRAAAIAGDPVAYRRAAHQTAGAAGAVGATALEAAARLAMGNAVQPAAMAATADDLVALSDAALRTSREFRGSLA